MPRPRVPNVQQDIFSVINGTAEPGIGFARADFKPELFDHAIRQKGMRVLWEQAMFCSCINIESGQPSYTCPECGGKAYIYTEPKETKALVTSINGRKEQDKQGLGEYGTAYLTPLSQDFVGYRDKFTFPDFKIKHSQLITFEYGDSMSSQTNYEILDVLVVQQSGNQLKYGIDFQVSEDRRHIELIDSGRGYTGTFSILYTIHPVYVAMGPIHELRGTYCMKQGQGTEYFVSLPSQFQIKREDFID